MSLDIGLAGDRPTAPFATAGPVVTFDDDEDGGYYWFLYPFFDRLARETGQFIDLYGVAEFRGDDLDALRQVVRDARLDAAARPDRWLVHVGTTTMPNATPPP